MPWVRIEDDYLSNGKVAKLSLAARFFDLAGIIYSARELRDGHLLTRDVMAIAGHLGLSARQCQRLVDELIAARRWTVEPDGWSIHDYLIYQPSREAVLAQREADRERKRSARESGRKARGVRDVPDPVPDVPNGTYRPAGRPAGKSDTNPEFAERWPVAPARAKRSAEPC